MAPEYGAVTPAVSYATEGPERGAESRTTQCLGGGESSRSLTAACSRNRSILLLVIVANLLLQLIYKLNFIAGMYKRENPVGTGSLLPPATGLAGGRGAFPAHKTGLLHSDAPTCLAPRPASHPDGHSPLLMQSLRDCTDDRGALVLRKVTEKLLGPAALPLARASPDSEHDAGLSRGVGRGTE